MENEINSIGRLLSQAMVIMPVW